MKPSVLQSEQINFSDNVHWHGNASPWNQNWEFEAGRWVHSEQGCTPCSPSAKLVLHLLLLSRVQGKMDLYLEEVFFSTCSACWGKVFCQALPSQAEVMFQWDSSYRLFWKLFAVISRSSNNYCIRELSLSTLLPGHQFCFLHQSLGFLLETAEGEAGCCCAKQTCQGRLLLWCIAGAHSQVF